jgi:hypothetical protein
VAPLYIRRARGFQYNACQMTKAGIWDYLKAAFSARPLGMFVPPNWVGLGAFALLGLLSPGLWLIGAGLELAYLYIMVSNRRFQRYVDATHTAVDHRQWAAKLQGLLVNLPAEDQRRYRTLEQRCQVILQQQQAAGLGEAADAQRQSLGRLIWIYLRLLVTRQSLVHVLRGSASVDVEPLDKRIKRIEGQLQQQDMNDELRRSLSGQVEILQQRIEKQHQAREKLQFLEAELARIEDQVELIREQAGLMSDPNALSERIDQIAATLGGTSQWIQEQQQVYGQVEDLLTEPPPVTLMRPESAKQAQ